ncbi:MAG: magnesium transporter [Anaerolineales bacterium]|nr:magnesium transporter [Anaerolineales bacterium]
MSDQINLENEIQKIRAAIQSQQMELARVLFLDEYPADQAEIFNELEEHERSLLLQILKTAETADLFDELEDEETLEAAESLTLEQLADVLDEMDPDEAADLLGDLPPEQAQEALAQMEDAEEVIPLLGYSDETAGGRATTAFVALRRHTTAAQAIQFLREVAPETDVPYYLFVIDRHKHLMGVTGLRKLVIADPHSTMEEIMDTDVVSILAGADQEEAARLMTRYDLSALPVIDADNHLVGVISHDDILDVLEDEATEDIYRLANVSDAELELDSRLGEQLRGRLPWLLLNTLTALLAAWVISRFGELFVQVAVLAFFQSIVAAVGGNAANQNVAMIVRAIALDNLELKESWGILGKQIIVGLVQGSVVGIVVGLGIGLWQQNPYLGLVMALALIGNLLVAGLVGTLTPLLLKAVGHDPALASSVLVTAATDSLGFLIFLSLASIFLPFIQQYLPV